MLIVDRMLPARRSCPLDPFLCASSPFTTPVCFDSSPRSGRWMPGSKGFCARADDYLPKPHGLLPELLAGIEVARRRGSGKAKPEPNAFHGQVISSRTRLSRSRSRTRAEAGHSICSRASFAAWNYLNASLTGQWVLTRTMLSGECLRIYHFDRRQCHRRAIVSRPAAGWNIYRGFRPRP